MPSQPLLKRDWVKDHVYHVQFPRAGCIPSASPFALKLETWLRMADIPYTNVSNEFKKFSQKGQIPFIEINGRQVADSSMIIEFLGEHFSKDLDAKLTPQERAQATAYKALLENHLFWTMVYYRSRNNKWMATEQGMIGHLSGVKKFVFQKFLCEKFRKKIAASVHTQGMGRNTQLEVDAIAKADLDALEALIGNKPYFFGPTPTSFDAAAFGLLCQFVYTPQCTDCLKKHIAEGCPCLAAFVDRVKSTYWPDWDEATSKLSLATQWKPQPQQ